jgi:hypothetical protein
MAETPTAPISFAEMIARPEWVLYEPPFYFDKSEVQDYAHYTGYIDPQTAEAKLEDAFIARTDAGSGCLAELAREITMGGLAESELESVVTKHLPSLARYVHIDFEQIGRDLDSSGDVADVSSSDVHCFWVWTNI